MINQDQQLIHKRKQARFDQQDTIIHLVSNIYIILKIVVLNKFRINTIGTFHYENLQILQIPLNTRLSILQSLHCQIQKEQKSIQGAFIYSFQYQSIKFISKIKVNTTEQTQKSTKIQMQQHFKSIAHTFSKVFTKNGIIKTNLKNYKYNCQMLRVQNEIKNIFYQPKNIGEKRKQMLDQQQQIKCKSSVKIIQNIKGSQIPTKNESQLWDASTHAIQSDIKLIDQNKQCEKQNIDQTSKEGGFFTVKVKKLKAKLQNQPNYRDYTLAVKVLKTERHAEKHNFYKIQKQLQLIKQIKNSQFLITYYELPADKNICYMQYKEYSLKDFLKFNKNISLTNSLDICIQIVKSIKNLHKSGVIHRDIKPSNYLIDYSQKGIRLKIIDFGQSAHINSQVVSNLGCTLPYSPIECYCNDQEGFNKFQIDYWSVGFLIYQIIFQIQPINFSRCFTADIKKGWKNDFCLILNRHRNIGQRFVLAIVSFMCFKMMKINQNLRLTLDQSLKVLEKTRSYLNFLKHL